MDKIAHLEFIIKNLREAKRVVEAAPQERFDLNSFRQEPGYTIAIVSKTPEPNCGTLYCSFGWLTTDDYFKSLGFALTPQWFEPVLHDKLLNWDEDDADAYFGSHAFAYLFATKHAGLNDYALHSENGLTHKELAVARFTLRIQQMEHEWDKLRYAQITAGERDAKI